MDHLRTRFGTGPKRGGLVNLARAAIGFRSNGQRHALFHSVKGRDQVQSSGCHRRGNIRQVEVQKNLGNEDFRSVAVAVIPCQGSIGNQALLANQRVNPRIQNRGIQGPETSGTLPDDAQSLRRELPAGRQHSQRCA